MTAARRVILLGSTGSIGTSTLDVIEHLNRTSARFEVVALAAGADADVLAAQAERCGAAHVSLHDASAASRLSCRARVHAGPEASENMVREVARPGDLVVGAIVGAAGLPATLAAIECGCDVALANKETLVAAGPLVMPRVRAKGVQLLPIDSEHSAIFQCLLAGRGREEIARLVLTASGGPFRTWSAARMAEATVDEALAHPTWQMGPKVTIDSATMMNKALELIEAHWLFDLPAAALEAIIHPQSIVHGFVEYVDGSVLAQLGPPDMRTPIQYALTWPERAAGCGRRLDWAELRQLEFEAVDAARFPAPGLARRVIETGGTGGAIFNGANEAAVAAYLAGRIGFGRIVELVADALDSLATGPADSLEAILAADATARAHVEGRLAPCESRAAGGR